MSAATDTGTRVAAAHSFLTTLYSNADVGHVVLWRLPDKKSQCFDLAEFTSLSDMAAVAVKLSDQFDVYTLVCPTSIPLKPYERGKSAAAKVVPGLHLDIDVKQGAFPTIDAAIAFAKSSPLRPSLLILSGGGVQAYWLFKEPYVIDSPSENHELDSLLERWHTWRNREAQAAGASLDATSDLARVLRVPGTYNHKTGTPRPVEILFEDETARYVIADFEEILPDDIPRGEDAPPAPEEGKTNLAEYQITTITEAIQPAWTDGLRHRLSFLIAGWLGTNQISEASAQEVVRRCSDKAGDRNPDAKQRNVQDTYAKLRAGVRPAGWSGLRQAFAQSPTTLQTLNDALVVRPTAGSNGHKPGGEKHEEATEPLDELPRINAQEQNIPEIADAAWNALVAANNPVTVVQLGDVLSRISDDDEGNPRIREVTESILAHELARVAVWTRQTKDPQTGVMMRKHAKVPIAVVQDMLAARAFPVPTLISVSRIPTFAPDGTLHEKRGYSPLTKSYYAPQRGVSIPPIPKQPTVADVAKAKSIILDDLLGDFSFAGKAEIANAVSIFLEVAVRNIIDGPTPLRLIEAPIAGSGKGLLVDALLMPSIGRNVAVMPAASDEAEWGKRIVSQLLKAPAAILIDNITKSLDSGSLAAVLTSPTYTDRQLGGNKMIELPVRCAWIATANNPTMSTEIARRTVRIRLDPKVDRPWERTGFRHENLREWVHENRGQLIWAALVLVRNWFAQGSEPGTKRLGSYESWSKVVGGILDAAKIDGFLTNLTAFYEASDLEGAIWREFVTAWFAKFGESEVGVSDLFDIAEKIDGFDLGTGSTKAQRTTFGIALNKQRDRVIGDFRIVQTRVVHQAKRWRLIKNRGGNPFEAFYTDEPGEPREPKGTSTRAPRENTDTDSVSNSEKVPRGSRGSPNAAEEEDLV